MEQCLKDFQAGHLLSQTLAGKTGPYT